MDQLTVVEPSTEGGDAYFPELALARFLAGRDEVDPHVYANGSIASALEDHFGDHHRSERTRSSELFINPLMCFLWAFDLAAVTRRSLYLHHLRGTQSTGHVQRVIEGFRRGFATRPRRSIPH